MDRILRDKSQFLSRLRAEMWSAGSAIHQDVSFFRLAFPIHKRHDVTQNGVAPIQNHNAFPRPDRKTQGMDCIGAHPIHAKNRHGNRPGNGDSRPPEIQCTVPDRLIAGKRLIHCKNDTSFLHDGDAVAEGKGFFMMGTDIEKGETFSGTMMHEFMKMFQIRL